MYLDPSFGGMLLQIIVVIAAVGGALVYSLRRKISALFTRKNKQTSIETTTKNSSGSISNETDNIIDMLSDDENQS